MHFVFPGHFNEKDMRHPSEGKHKKLKSLNFTKWI